MYFEIQKKSGQEMTYSKIIPLFGKKKLENEKKIAKKIVQ